MEEYMAVISPCVGYEEIARQYGLEMEEVVELCSRRFLGREKAFSVPKTVFVEGLKMNSIFRGQPHTVIFAVHDCIVYVDDGDGNGFSIAEIFYAEDVPESDCNSIMCTTSLDEINDY